MVAGALLSPVGLVRLFAIKATAGVTDAMQLQAKRSASGESFGSNGFSW